MLSPQRRDPDRLLPADPRTREIARSLYEAVAQAPIISPHGHVPVELLRDDLAFEDPVALLVAKDHYVTRLLHAAGVDYAALGLGGHRAEPREVWRILGAHWHLFSGTASGYWLEEELSQVLGVDSQLDVDSADGLYDAISERLAAPGFRPRALFERFGIEVLATTDDPLDDLAVHAALAGTLPGRVLPTFRPDRYLDPDAECFRDDVEKLLGSTGKPTTFAGYLGALEERRAHFRAHGAVSGRPRRRAAAHR